MSFTSQNQFTQVATSVVGTLVDAQFKMLFKIANVEPVELAPDHNYQLDFLKQNIANLFAEHIWNCKEGIQPVKGQRTPLPYAPEQWHRVTIAEALDHQYICADDIDMTIEDTPQHILTHTGLWIVEHKSGKYSTVAERDSEYGEFKLCVDLLNHFTL